VFQLRDGVVDQGTLLLQPQKLLFRLLQGQPELAVLEPVGS